MYIDEIGSGNYIEQIDDYLFSFKLDELTSYIGELESRLNDSSFFDKTIVSTAVDEMKARLGIKDPLSTLIVHTYMLYAAKTIQEKRKVEHKYDVMLSSDLGIDINTFIKDEREANRNNGNGSKT